MPTGSFQLPPTLYVVVGGNGTCNRRRQSDFFDGLIDNSLFRNFNQEFILTGVVRDIDEILFFCYERNQPLLYVYTSKTSEQMQRVYEANVPEVIANRARPYGETVIVGHSYGGWLAIKAAAYLAGQVPPVTLITIDPVSKVTCDSFFDEGCREAPFDIEIWEANNLTLATRWLNIFQEARIFVGSSPTRLARRNFEVKANHHNIVRKREVWNEAREWVQTSVPQN